MSEFAPTEKEKREQAMLRLNRALEAADRQEKVEKALGALRSQPWFIEMNANPTKRTGGRK